MLSDRARVIAEMPAFPVTLHGDSLDMPVEATSDGDVTTYTGMTYHQWLVGQALAGGFTFGNAREQADGACEQAAAREALAEREP